MRYMGGKHRLGARLAAVVQRYAPTHYHEPFCGMLSVGRYVEAETRTAADTHPDLVLLLQAVQAGWRGPDHVTLDEWLQARTWPLPSALRGFIGFGCSFGGRFFGAYARSGWTWEKSEWKLNAHNFARRMNVSLDKIRPQLQGMTITQQDYREYNGQADVLYADPPYTGANHFTHGTFNTDEFWDWVRRESVHRVVVVSEMNDNAPRDMDCIAEFPSAANCNSNSDTRHKIMERLFVYNTNA